MDILNVIKAKVCVPSLTLLTNIYISLQYDERYNVLILDEPVVTVYTELRRIFLDMNLENYIFSE